MFQLKPFEYENIQLQVNAIKQSLSSQIVMMSNLPQNRTDKYLPYAFTEQGVAMLSGVLRSAKGHIKRYNRQEWGLREAKDEAEIISEKTKK